MKTRSPAAPPERWTVEQVRQFLERQHPEDFTLLDVGLPEEFAAGHLPGARLLPLAELSDKAGELDSGKTTVVYDASGLRSRTAAAVLSRAGFPRVAVMEGGLESWRGGVAKGLPEVETGYLPTGASAEEQVLFAWQLEESNRLFYAEIAAELRDPEAVSLFRELAGAEEQHRKTLTALYEGLRGRPVPADFPRGLVPATAEGRLEGGMRLQEALAWSRGKPARSILELALAIEAGAYDHYLYLRRELADEDARRVFEILSDEERRHLRKLSEVLVHFV